MTGSRKRKNRNLFSLVFLDLKSGDQGPSVETKVDLEDKNSSGTNNLHGLNVQHASIAGD